MKIFCTFLLILLGLTQLVFAAQLRLETQVSGISNPALQNVNESLNNKKSKLPKVLTYNSIREFYDTSPELVNAALQPYGYFHALIRKSMNRRQQTYTIQYNIVPGPATFITHSEISLTGSGQLNHNLNKLLHHVRKKLKVGSQLNTVEYENLKQRFYAIAEEQGYIKGFFSTHKILVNKKTNQAQVLLTFDTGPRYYFGAVYFSKNPMDTNFLKKFLAFKPGDPYSPNKLLTSQSNLAGTVYFNHVNMTPKIKHAHNHIIPVDVKLGVPKAQEYSFGVGYGTDTGARGSLGWQWRRVTPTGDYLRTLLQITQKQNDNFQAQYIIPGKHPVTDSYAISAGIFTNKPGDDDDKYTTTQIGFSYVKLINQWKRTLSLQLQHENFTVDNKSETTNTLLPSVSWEKIVANNRVNTVNGYRLFFQVQTGLVNKTSASFLQGEFRGKLIRSFDKQNYRLLLSTDIGATAVRDFDTMPLSQRFFAGGAQSLRGYDYQALGPGRYLITGSVEFQRRIYGNFYGAVFYNAGNAIQNFPLHLQQAAGLGVLFRSPLGPIEVTVAHPFGEELGLKHGLMVQFSMGPDL